MTPTNSGRNLSEQTQVRRARFQVSAPFSS